VLCAKALLVLLGAHFRAQKNRAGPAMLTVSQAGMAETRHEASKRCKFRRRFQGIDGPSTWKGAALGRARPIASEFGRAVAVVKYVAVLISKM